MVEKRTLPNGLRVVFEHLPHVRSCALGVWVQSGSRHEPEALCGVSHFIEHMLFKGTGTYTAEKLAEAFDAIGGQVNAFTTKENTCYYARTLDTHLVTAAKLLADMYFNSAFEESATNLERGVILEEIGMYEDTPEDLCNELLFAAVYAGSSLARPILGTADTLKNMNGAALSRYRTQNYTPENTLLALSGSFPDADLDAVVALFAGQEKNPPPTMEGAAYRPAYALKRKEIEQNHLIVGFPGLALGDPRRYALQCLNNILGAGMSSRLFQRVREHAGLCYSIYSFASMYMGAGLFGVYTALGKDTESRALALIRQEIERFKVDGVTADELTRTKEQLKSGVLMGMESTT
jgi:predicted Zn-dependent peptidase